MTKRRKVSKEAMDWATEQIASGVLSSPMAINPDGSLKTLRQLLDESRPDGEEAPAKEG